uniref:Ubiquitin carboxyl-terminal hydrolase n=1 Tax=Salarias fasciatus TaxID=181472 RepID=A0A672I2K1_SALFA
MHLRFVLSVSVLCCRFLMGCRWFHQWKLFVESGDQNSSCFPGEIDNTELFEDTLSYRLKERLVENEDFVLVPVCVWNKLVSWYGVVEEQPAVERKVVDLPSTLKVEVYPVEIFLCLHSNMENVIAAQFSRTNNIYDIQKALCEAFMVPPESECRLWMKSSDSSCERLRNLFMSVLDSCLSSGMVSTHTLEIKLGQNADGTWPSSKPQVTNSVEYRGQPGVCGLTNLGNTCFMNSALQCLSNVPPLTEYFLGTSYLKELNFSNPLGMKGEIAEAFADIIKQMWSGRVQCVVPRIFKMKVGHFASQFLGYQQHDSQELLSFLLDGLHEDLNRVKNKEYIELRDADGRPDQEVAEEAWRNHQRRNDSVIVDTFHGLFKSTLVCPECHKVSVTFDPFCYLSVPLPVSTERVMEVFFVSLDPYAKPVQVSLHIQAECVCVRACVKLHSTLTVVSVAMVVADVFNHRFYKIYTAEEALSIILDRDDIFVYELSAQEEEQGEVVLLALYLRERSSYKEYGMSLFGHPLLLNVLQSSCSQEALYSLILQRLQSVPHTCTEVLPFIVPLTTKNHLRRPLLHEEKEGEQQEEEEEEEEEEKNEEEDQEEKEEAGAAAEARSPSPVTNKHPAKRRKQLFTIQEVNSNGTTERAGGDGDQFLSFTQPYVAIDWDPDMKKRFYNENEAEMYVKHANMDIPHQQTKVQLQECIELFTTVETLEEENPWYCPECKKHQLATKKLDLWSLPEVLIIHLKRFSYTKSTREKLDSMVDFPLRSEPPSRYDLIAVSNHYGGLRDGHYTSYAQNKDNALWYYFDDSKVTYAQEEQIVTNAAYVLFYHRQDKLRKPTLPAPSASPASSTQDAFDNTDCKDDDIVPGNTSTCVTMETD